MSANPLSAGISFSDLGSDPGFMSAPTDTQAQYLLEDYLPKKDKAFAKAPIEQKQQYIQEVVLPEIQKLKAPNSNFFTDLGAAAINSGSAGIVDIPHGQGWGANIGNVAGPLIGSLGAVALAPETGGASLAIPAAYLGAVGAGNTAREQINRTGRIENPLAVGASGITNAAVGILGPVGGSLSFPARAALNAGVDAVTGGGQDIIQQAAEQHTWTPNIDWRRASQSALTGAGLGAGFSLGKNLKRAASTRFKMPKEAPKVEAPTLQARISNAEELSAQEIADLLQSQNAAERARGIEALSRARRVSNKAKGKDLPDNIRQDLSSLVPEEYERGRALREDYQRRQKELVAQVSILKEQNKKTANQRESRSKEEINRAVKLGQRARKPVESGLGQKSSGALKAQFDNYLKKRFSPDEQRIINARIGESIKQKKSSDVAISEKAKERLKKRQAKQQEKQKALAKKAQEEKRAAIKAENEKLAAEIKKQAAEKKIAGLPKVLTPEEIELQAETLYQNSQKNEKGTLEAEVSKIRRHARTDFSKTGLVDKARSDAINETHARVLDRYHQKKAQGEQVRVSRKPENIVKARAENLKDLEAAVKRGGSYDFNTGKGKQASLSAEQLRWEDVRDSIADPELKAWGEIIDTAMKNDGVILNRYDSERTGDTGEFERKELSPIDWGFNFSYDQAGKPIATKVVFHAYNKYGHKGEYYLEPSDANPKTGTVSATLEQPTILKGKTAFRGTEPNVYKGQREFKIADVMARPPRRVQGLTSEGQAKLIEARAILNKYDAGESVSANEIKKAGNKARSAQKEATQAAKGIVKTASKSKAVKKSLENEKVTPDDLKNMSQEMKDVSKSTTDEASNC